MTRYTPLIAVTLMATCGACAGLRVGARSPAEQTRASVVILSHCSNFLPGYVSAGSGVQVSPTQVVTAAHVVDCVDDKAHTTGQVSDVWAFETDGTGHPMRVDRVDELADQARLSIADDAEFYRTPSLRFGAVGPGDQACISTGGPTRDRRCGVVDDAPDGWISFSIPVEPGNSGSPLYDRDGRLVGIVTRHRMLSTGQNTGGLAVPLTPTSKVVRP